MARPSWSVQNRSKSRQWHNLFAMFANKHSCSTMQSLEYWPCSGWYTSPCCIPSGCNVYYDLDNENQALCFTGSHSRCYVWLVLYIHCLDLCWRSLAQNTEQLLCCILRKKRCLSCLYNGLSAIVLLVKQAQTLFPLPQGAFRDHLASRGISET